MTRNFRKPRVVSYKRNTFPPERCIFLCRSAHIFIVKFVVVWCCVSACYGFPVWALDPNGTLTAAGTETKVTEPGHASEPAGISPWFFLISMVNVYPKLESENLIKQYYDPAMRLFAPGFEDVRTVASLRDEHLLWTPSFSIGRVLSHHLALYFQFGYSAGKVRTKANDTSIFLLPFHTDFEIFRSAAYFGLCADVFPWGMTETKTYTNLRQRFKDSKPYLGFRLTETHAGFKVKAKAGFGSIYNFLDFKLKDDWWVTSVNANLGLDIPWNNRNVMSLNAGYNFACTRGFDFSGPAITIGWKRFF